MNGHKILKDSLLAFWSKFGGRKNNGVGFNPESKLKSLIEMAALVIAYKKQQPLDARRDQFDEAKSGLHPFRRFGVCFVCGLWATCRHHIVQLQHGGINSKKNVVSLCDKCHAEIHPWLR